MEVDNSLLSIDFDEVNEYFAILNTRISLYRDVIEDLRNECGNCKCSQEDIKAINLQSHDSNGDVLVRQANIFVTKNIEIRNLIYAQLKAADLAYSKIFLNPDMIGGAINGVIDKPNFDNDLTVNDIYKVKKLDFVSIDGKITCNKSEEELDKIDEEFLNAKASVEMGQDDFIEIIQNLGILSKEQKDAITEATLNGTLVSGGFDISSVLGININVLGNGRISISGSNKAVMNFFGKNIRVCKPSTLIKTMLQNSKETAVSSFDFGAGLSQTASAAQKTMAKVNSVIMYANIVNNADDAYKNWKVTGDVTESAVGFGIDAGVTVGSAYISGAAATTIAGILSVGSGGTVVIAVIAGTIIAYFYNKYGSKLKQLVFDTIDDVEDYIRNQNDPDLCIGQN